MKVRYSRRALAQLQEIHNYIAPFNPRAAVAVVERMRDAVAAWIEEARALGRPVPTPSRRHVAAEWAYCAVPDPLSAQYG
jgi:plasmid stabilization system protein ParE